MSPSRPPVSAPEQRHVRRLAAARREVAVEADDVVVGVTRRGRAGSTPSGARPRVMAEHVVVQQRVTGFHGEPAATERHDLRDARHGRSIGPKRSVRADFLLWSNAYGPPVESSGARDRPMPQRGHPPLRGHLRAVVRPRRDRGPADGACGALVRDRHADRRGDRARRRRALVAVLRAAAQGRRLLEQRGEAVAADRRGTWFDPTLVDALRATRSRPPRI